jgi:hypothetical protein
MWGIQGTTKQYAYMGYEYRTYDDVEDDNIKTFHLCFKDGLEVKLPYEFYNHSPYSLVEVDTFKRLIDSQLLVDFVGV